MGRRWRRLRRRLQRFRFEAPGVLSSWLFHARSGGVDAAAVPETWDAVADGAHNSNTDLIFWHGSFYLCHQTSPYHMGSERSRLLLWRSPDARTWELVREFKAERGEYRDPKFAAIHDRLFLYVLPNVTFMAEPVTTVYTSSADGATWDAPVEMAKAGWLFWRPKTRDSATWYVTAYWHEHGKSVLLRSQDGVGWTTVSPVYEGERNDETDFEFLPDGRILATARLEGNGNEWGDATASTLNAVAPPPYERWTYSKSHVTRLDGPCLFPYNGRTYAIGRYQATRAPRFVEQGGLYSRKRTSVFLVEETGLRRLTDLPSNGDTSYAGVARRGDELYASYYTSPLDHDYTWIQGMLRPSHIRMARICLPALEALALAGKIGPQR